MKKTIMVILMVLFSQVAMAAIELDAQTFNNGEAQYIGIQTYDVGLYGRGYGDGISEVREMGMNQQVWGSEIRGF